MSSADFVDGAAGWEWGPAQAVRLSPAADARRQAIERRARRQAQTTAGLPGAACRRSNETILYACRPHRPPVRSRRPGTPSRIFTAYLPYWLVLSESNRAPAGNSTPMQSDQANVISFPGAARQS